jgi:hypothetical protein
MNLMISALLVLSLFAQAPARRPVPTEAELQEARKTVVALFKEDYSKTTPADRLKLSRKLLSQGIQTKDDDVSRYVLLKEATDMAIQAVNADVALRAIEEIGRSFEAGVLPLKTSAFTTMSKGSRTAEEQKGTALLGLRIVEDACAVDDYSVAEQMAAGAVALARKAKDMPLIIRSEAKTKDVAALKSGYERMQKARETLARNPEDPDANLTVGQFLTFIKGNWIDGLPLLAKAADAELKALASKDVALPSEAADQIALGDGWWERAAKEKGALQNRLRERAETWYEKGLPGLTGLSKTKIEKRLLELRMARLSAGSWVDVADPAAFGLQGKPGAPIELLGPSIGGKEVSLQKWPPGEFDGVSIRVRHVDGRGAGVIYYGPGYQCSIFKGSFGAVRMDPNNAPLERAEKQLPGNGEIELTVVLRDWQFVIHLDGKEVGRLTASVDRVTPLRLNALGGAVAFEHIRLRRKE